MMSLRRKPFTKTFVLLVRLLFIVSVNSLKFINNDSRRAGTIQKYFPHEKSLCVVLAKFDKEDFLPKFDLPVVVFTRDKVLQDCKDKSTDQDGYVFMTSNAASLEEQIVPLLKCCNQTTLKLKTKYILVLDLSKNSNPTYFESYSNFFHSLWISFGIINIAILPVQGQNLDSLYVLVFLYNPFVARHNTTLSALKRTSFTEDVRRVMNDQFRDMQGHALRSVFYQTRASQLRVVNKATNTLGTDPALLFKYILEVNLNVSFVAYDPLKDEDFKSEWKILIREFASGRADYCMNFLVLKTGVDWLKHVQIIPHVTWFKMVFVVPKPRLIESWRLLLYLFQWQVCVGLGVVMFLFSIAAVLFVRTQPETDTSSGTSEVMNVWRASLSLPIKRTPRTHSQRLLIACALLIGLVFLTIFSAQMFFLVKSKPRSNSIRTLQDLLDSNLPIYPFYPGLSQYLNIFENTTLRGLEDNLKTDKIYETAHHVLDPNYLNITDRAVIYTETMVELVILLPQSKAFLEYFEIVKEPISQSSTVVCLPVGSVYYDHINNLNLRVKSGGFYRKWYDAFNHKIVEHHSASTPRRATAEQSPLSADDSVPLTYDDLRIAFYFLYTGLALSALCFLIELFNF